MTRPDELGVMPRGGGDLGFITSHPERARLLERANLFDVIGRNAVNYAMPTRINKNQQESTRINKNQQESTRINKNP